MTKRAFTPAFTLVELMISIALVVILMAGVAQVFSLTSKTASATQGVSSQLRDSRAAQTVFYNDLQNIASDGPFMLLHSRAQQAFNTKLDQLTDSDWNQDPASLTGVTTIDVDGNNIEGETASPPQITREIVSPSTYNYRNHRIDTFSFFARGRFDRQTGNHSGPYQSFVADESENEAWIWYGHLEVTNNSGQGRPPAIGTNNDNNRYASQFVLGRMVMLLREATDPMDMAKWHDIWDRNSPPRFQNHIEIDRSVAKGESLRPLSKDSLGEDHNDGTSSPIYTSYYDLAETSISGYRGILNDFTSNYPNVAWWSNMLVGEPNIERFLCNPFPGRPMSSGAMAQLVPMLLQNCTQFMVEYAGDFVAQDTTPTSVTYGQVTNTYFQIDPQTPPGTDGQLDFVVTYDANNVPTKKIRWYGLPRDLDNDGFIAGAGVPRNSNQMPDVVPLRDVILSAVNSTVVTMSPTLKAQITANFNQAPFERIIPPATTIPKIAVRDNYASPSAGMLSTEYYTCTWGPSDTVRPKMIRILALVNAANIDHEDGQRFEWIIKLP